MTNAHDDSEYPFVPISFERSVLEGEDVPSLDKDRTRERGPVRYFVAAFLVGAVLLVTLELIHVQPKWEWLHSLAVALAEALAVGGAIGGCLNYLPQSISSEALATRSRQRCWATISRVASRT